MYSTANLIICALFQHACNIDDAHAQLEALEDSIPPEKYFDLLEMMDEVEAALDARRYETLH